MKNKIINTRVISFTELTFDNGDVQIKPDTADFNDFEIIGILQYYKDVFQVQMMKSNSDASKESR
jgi:hypothetical protein